MAKLDLKDEEVKVEIIRLRQSEYVKLAQKEEKIKKEHRNRIYRVQFMEKLQYLEYKGKRLAEQGYTLDNIAERMREDNDEIN